MTEIIVEKVPADLEGLIPSFFTNTNTEIVLLQSAIEARDLEAVHRLGHNIKGSALNYGFSHLAEIGRSIEIAGGEGNMGRALQLLEKLQEYVKCVEVVFV